MALSYTWVFFMPEILFVFLNLKEIACAPAFCLLERRCTLGPERRFVGVAESRKRLLEPTCSSQPSTGCTKGPQSCFVFVFPQRITRIRMYLQSDLG